MLLRRDGSSGGGGGGSGGGSGGLPIRRLRSECEEVRKDDEMPTRPQDTRTATNTDTQDTKTSSGLLTHSHPSPALIV